VNIFNVDLVMGSSHHVAVGRVASIVYICAASMFRIKVSRVCNCLGYLCIDPEERQHVPFKCWQHSPLPQVVKLPT